MLHAFLKYEIKKWGQWCKFWDIGQIIQSPVKTQVDFIQTFIIHVNFFPKLSVKKHKNCFKSVTWILFQIFLAQKKSSISRNIDILNAIQTYWIIKKMKILKTITSRVIFPYVIYLVLYWSWYTCFCQVESAAWTQGCFVPKTDIFLSRPVVKFAEL